MIDYRAGDWGFHVAFGLQGSLAPRALVMAVPNAILTLVIATMLLQAPPDSELRQEETVDGAQIVIAAVTPIMIFILYNRSRTSYDRWWEGGTLLQKTRGEWFNAYSSIMAFTSTKPELQDQVDAYVHLLARLMSLLMCCGLQQVSPNRDRPFEIIDLDGIEPASMEFLNAAPDKVEIILQWIQRSMVLHQQTGVLPVAPPILSRAFQEVSRGIVNLQNARKIADFPYPYPLAQVSMILQLLHWAATPFAAALAMPRVWAFLFAFFSIFVLWCIHFNALDLEFPFGNRLNDLPMQELQQDWNNSICTLVAKRATRPPRFDYDPIFHDGLTMAMSDASDLYVPKAARLNNTRRKIAVIRVTDNKRKTMESIAGRLGQLRNQSKDNLMTTIEEQVSSRPLGSRELGPPRESSTAAPDPARKQELSEERIVAPASASTTQVTAEMPAKKEGADVSANDTLLSTAATAGPNDTIVSIANSSQTSANPASSNLIGVPAALVQVRLPEPLVLDKTAGPSCRTEESQSSVAEKQVGDSKRTRSEPLAENSAATSTAANKEAESRCRGSGNLHGEAASPQGAIHTL